ncbi:MAG: hypothetical protein LQ349_008848 [Xanthoria aureola]|nr:MAG: hypothetical protein LQ349_008848 [Xanthoria aureola]
MSSYKRPVGRPSGGQPTGRFDVGLTKEELKQCEEQAYQEFEVRARKMDADFRATINGLNNGKYLTVHADLTSLRFVDSRIGRAPKYGMWQDVYNCICMKILYEKQSRVLWSIMLDREREAERRRARYLKVKANQSLREPVEKGDEEIGKEGQPIIQQAGLPSPPSPRRKRRHGDTGGNGEMTLLEKAIQ